VCSVCVVCVCGVCVCVWCVRVCGVFAVFVNLFGVYVGV